MNTIIQKSCHNSLIKYVGLDIHQSSTAIHVLDQNGKKILTHTVRGDWTDLFNFLKSIPGDLYICYEASNGYGYLYDNFNKLAKKVVVAHPGQLRLIFKSKKKNDRADAEKLAVLLFLDQVPAIHVPDINIRDWRRLIGLRLKTVESSVRIKGRLRSLLRHIGRKAPCSLWTKEGMEWLKNIQWPTSQLALEYILLIDELAGKQIMLKKIEDLLKTISDLHPGVALLMTVPGIGIRTAETLVAWIDDPNRFHKTNRIGSYFGLVPSQDASAGRNHLGHITKQGPAVVRKYLCEAAWRSIKLSPKITAFFDRVQRKDQSRKKIALTATAHLLARITLSMLKNKQPWQEPKTA